MTKKHKPVDWSEGHFKQMLVQHRKFMWRQDSIEMFPKWLGLKHGMTAVDVVCGSSDVYMVKETKTAKWACREAHEPRAPEFRCLL